MFKYKGKTISEIVKREDWQKVRVSLLGHWKEHPERNVKILKEFLGDIKETETEKLIIVYNYLTGSVFRSKTIVNQDAMKLKERIKKELKVRFKKDQKK